MLAYTLVIAIYRLVDEIGGHFHSQPYIWDVREPKRKIVSIYKCKYFRSVRTVFLLFPMRCSTQKCDLAVEISFLTQLIYIYIYIGISAMEANILGFPLPVCSDSICTCPIQLLNFINVGLVVVFLFASHLNAETLVFPAWRPPYGVFRFR